jgi:membrane protein implicated in regulation of membrane protease activity
MVGSTGRVVTPLVGGRGEVLVRLGGQPRKLSALADHDVELGATVVVIERISESSVRVMAQDAFWAETTDPSPPITDP